MCIEEVLGRVVVENPVENHFNHRDRKDGGTVDEVTVRLVDQSDTDGLNDKVELLSWGTSGDFGEYGTYHGPGVVHDSLHLDPKSKWYSFGG